MTNIKKTFYVVRDMWDGKLRGAGSLLHSTKDKRIKKRTDINPVQMCCLGHMCIQEKPDKLKDIYGMDYPSEAGVDLSMYVQPEIMCTAAGINDSERTLQKKEEELTKLFAQEGVELKFVDTIHNLPNPLRKIYSKVRDFIKERKS